METLSFSTSPARRRDDQPVPVTLCGEQLVVKRPKDAVLYFAQTVAGDTVSDADRAMAILQFLDGALDVVDRKRFFDRVIDRDDPLDLTAAIQLVSGLLSRWNQWPDNGDVDPLVIDPDEVQAPRGGPVRVENPDLGLTFTAHPPKDLVLLCVSASLATGANIGQQAWAIGLFLDAALDTMDSVVISQRMRSRDDEVDLHHITEIAEGLIDRWGPRQNRAARRALARG